MRSTRTRMILRITAPALAKAVAACDVKASICICLEALEPLAAETVSGSQKHMGAYQSIHMCEQQTMSIPQHIEGPSGEMHRTAGLRQGCATNGICSSI